MPKLSEKFREASDTSIATEVAFTLLGNDRHQKTLSRLAAVLGFENTVKVMLMFGGTTVAIPSLKHFTTKLRLVNAALEKLGGARSSVVAKRHKLSERLIVKAAGMIEKQRELRKVSLREFTDALDKFDIGELTNQEEV